MTKRKPAKKLPTIGDVARMIAKQQKRERDQKEIAIAAAERE